MEGNGDILVALGAVAIAIVVGLWNNWIFIGPDGYTLTGKDRPSLLRFYVTLFLHPIDSFNGRAFWPKENTGGDKAMGCSCRRDW